MTPPAAGAFSATWITRIGGLVFALILAGAFLVQSCFSTVPTDPESLREPEGIAGDRATVQLGARVQDLEQRAALDAAAAERELATQGAGLGGAQLTPAFNETTGEALPGPPVPLTEGEAELREVLRLEAIERRTRSLRSAPIAITYRRPESGGLRTAAAEPTADAPAQADAPIDDRASTPLIPEPVSLMDTIQALQALDAQQTAGAEPDAGRAFPSGRQIQPPAVSPLGSPDSARVAQGDPVHPAIVRSPNTPPGWERVYEGSFIEAVLVTQLNGDFPGPVLASVAVPFYSVDRQRIVIPRGARVIGSASAVAGQDQERLAVGFHRLIFPDGRWVSLGVSRAESDRRRRAEGSSEPPLLVDVRQRRRGRHYVRADLARVEPVCRRHGGRARGCRARARARRDEHPRPLPQPFTDYHDPRRPPAPDLVDVRCACAASR